MYRRLEPAVLLRGDKERMRQEGRKGTMEQFQASVNDGKHYIFTKWLPRSPRCSFSSKDLGGSKGGRKTGRW